MGCPRDDGGGEGSSSLGKNYQTGEWGGEVAADIGDGGSRTENIHGRGWIDMCVDADSRHVAGFSHFSCLEGRSPLAC